MHGFVQSVHTAHRGEGDDAHAVLYYVVQYTCGRVAEMGTVYGESLRVKVSTGGGGSLGGSLGGSGEELARAKFAAHDQDGGGTLDRAEVQQMLAQEQICSADTV